MTDAEANALAAYALNNPGTCRFTLASLDPDYMRTADAQQVLVDYCDFPKEKRPMYESFFGLWNEQMAIPNNTGFWNSDALRSGVIDLVQSLQTGPIMIPEGGGVRIPEGDAGNPNSPYQYGLDVNRLAKPCPLPRTIVTTKFNPRTGRYESTERCKPRRMNPCNPRALGRAARRLSAFQHMASRVEKIINHSLKKSSSGRRRSAPRIACGPRRCS